MLLVLTTSMMMLVACNETSDASLNAEEIYTEALEASEAMNSAEVTIDMKQEIGAAGESTMMEMETNLESEMILEPLAIHQKGTLKMVMGEEEQETEMEQYMLNDEMYMYEGFTGSWMKMDSEMVPLDMMEEQQQDPAEQLKMMEQFIEDVSVEQANGHITLKLAADGEKFKDLAEDMMSQDMMSELGDLGTNVFENMSINDLYYEIQLDEETYEMNSVDMDIDMTMSMGSEEMDLVQSVQSTYKNINNIDAIDVPEEVKNAVN